MKQIEDLKKYREMNEKDLRAQLEKQQKEVVLLSLKVKAGKADNMSEIGKKRKDIARILTVLNEKTA